MLICGFAFSIVLVMALVKFGHTVSHLTASAAVREHSGVASYHSSHGGLEFIGFVIGA